MKDWPKAWPDEVEIPDEVGRGKYTYPDGRPCCAVGHFAAVFDKQFCRQQAYAAYKTCWKSQHGDSLCSIVKMNDSIRNPAERRIIYLAALAYLGYEEGLPEEALEIAKKAKGGGK